MNGSFRADEESRFRLRKALLQGGQNITRAEGGMGKALR